MNDDNHLHPDPELRRCPETGNWPGTWRSPSQRRDRAHDLARESSIIWQAPEAEARRLPWARERFGKPSRSQKGLIARSVDGRGRTIRYWVCRPDDRDAYGDLLRKGCGTAPIEAVWPSSIAVGRPAPPAHPHLLPLMWQAIAAEEGHPIELPQLEPAPAAEALKLESVMAAFWRGLMPDGEAVRHG